METSTSQQRRFRFHGEGSELFGIFLANFFLTLITAGIYYPWAKVTIEKFMLKNTDLDGAHFEYEGRGSDLFIGILKAFGLVILLFALSALATYMEIPGADILFGVLFYVGFILAIPYSIHGSMKYETTHTSWKGIYFGYDGDLKELMKLFIKGFLLTIVTFGFYGSWFINDLRTYLTSHTRFGNIKFSFSGKGMDFFMLNLKGVLLTIITLGIYGSWYSKDVFNFAIENTYLEQNGTTLRLRSKLKGGDLFIKNIVITLLIVFTFGIGFAWAVVKMRRFLLEQVTLEGELDLEAVRNVGEEYKDATGPALADMLDVEI